MRRQGFRGCRGSIPRGSGFGHSAEVWRDGRNPGVCTGPTGACGKAGARHPGEKMQIFPRSWAAAGDEVHGTWSQNRHFFRGGLLEGKTVISLKSSAGMQESASLSTSAWDHGVGSGRIQHRSIVAVGVTGRGVSSEFPFLFRVDQPCESLCLFPVMWTSFIRV
jgi:hypothetical protein